VNYIAIIIKACLFSALMSLSSAATVSASELGHPAEVLAVQASAQADLVVVKAGNRQGIEPGMVFQVKRSGALIGELLVTRTGEQCSVAIILDKQVTKAMAAGDMAILKRKTL